VQRDIAARRQGSDGAVTQGAIECVHRKVVGNQQPVEPDPAADHLGDDVRGGRCRPIGVQSGIQDMGGHCTGKIGQRAERREIDGFERVAAGVDHGQADMAVGAGAAVAGDMLDHRQHAAVDQPVGHRPAEQGDRGGVGGEGPVADDVVGAGRRHVEHRRAVDGDAEVRQLQRDQGGVEPGRRDRRRLRPSEQLTEAPGRRRFAPVRRAQSGDAATLLVDQHRRVGAADGVAQRRGQRADLVRRLAVAGEQDEAGGIGVAEEAPLPVV
jgi:hypothetical protein